MFRPCLDMVWVGEVRCGRGSSVEGFCGLRMCRILSGVDEEVCGRHYCRYCSRTSPTQTAAANQPDIQLCFSHLCTTSTLWPEDGQARPKHVVAIAAINRITRELCFWRTLLPSFNIRKHNGDDEPEDRGRDPFVMDWKWFTSKRCRLIAVLSRHFPVRTERNYEKCQSRHPRFGPIFEPSTFEVRGRARIQIFSKPLEATSRF
jgi:hypothetical protein